MSTLSSASTLAQVEAAYDDNASYAEDNSVPKAKAFLTACRLWLRRAPRESGTPQAHFVLNSDLVQKQMEAAEDWLEAHDTGPASTTSGPRVTRVSFENTR